VEEENRVGAQLRHGQRKNKIKGSLRSGDGTSQAQVKRDETQVRKSVIFVLELNTIQL
jgi:hypothetical protein